MKSKTIRSTFLHMAEFAVAICIAIVTGYAAKALLGIDVSDAVKAVLAVALGGMFKGARASDAIPLPDYVNGEK